MLYQHKDNTKDKTNPGRYLIHCQAGQSRSMFAALGIVMAQNMWGFEKAVEEVHKMNEAIEDSADTCIRQRGPVVFNSQPFNKSKHLNNILDNFKTQLEIFSKLDFSINKNKSSQLYRNFRFNLLNLSETGSAIPSSKTDILWSNINDKIGGKAHYRCSKCRKKLFQDAHIVKSSNTNHYLHPLDWMASMLYDPDLLDPVKGKLYCPDKKCANKLGHFLWYGEKIDTGEWMCPVFNVSVKKCDKIVL